MKLAIIENLRGKIDDEKFKNFSEWVESGSTMTLPKLRKLASRYKQKYIFEKLKEDDEIQRTVNELTILLQEKQTDLIELQDAL